MTSSARNPSAVRTVVHALFIVVHLILIAALLAWIAGRLLTDAFAWSQWLWWTPTFIAGAIALFGVIIACIEAFFSRRRRAGSRRFGWLRRKRILFWFASLIALVVYFGAFEHRYLAYVKAYMVSPVDNPSEGFEFVHWTCTMSAPHLRKEHAKWAQTFNGDIDILMHSGGLAFDPTMQTVRDRGYAVYPIGLATVITRAPLLEHRPIVVNFPYIVRMMKFDLSAIADFSDTPNVDHTLTVWLVDLPSDPKLSRYDVSVRLQELIASSTEQPPEVIIGDFNIQRGSASLKQVFPDHEHAFAQAGYGYGATFPRERPIYHIDHILLRAPWRASRYDIEDPQHGRHRRQRVFLYNEQIGNPALGRSAAP